MTTGSNGSNINNINQKILSKITVPVPSEKIQQDLLKQIRAKESVISEAQSMLDAATSRKQAVLDKYLQ